MIAAFRSVLDRGVRRYPEVRQRDETDCAAACLAMVAAFHGRTVGIARLRDLANVDAHGATLWSVARAAETLGFRVRGLALQDDALDRVALPAIVHWERKHYVVVYALRGPHVIIGDPALGRRRLTRDEFRAGFSGRLLELQSIALDANAEPVRSPWARFVPLVMHYRAMLAEVLLASLVLSVLGLGLPFFTQLIIDRVLVDESAALLDVLVVGALLLVTFKSIIEWVRQRLLIHVSTRVDARLISDFLGHVFALPMRYFDLRRVGDVVSRVSETEKVRAALASTIPALGLDTVLACGYLAMLASYDLRMTAMVLVVIGGFVGLMCVFTPIMRRRERHEFATRMAAQSHCIESITGMQTVKSMALESHLRWRLESLFTEALNAAQRTARIAGNYAGSAGFLQASSAVVLLWAGAHRVLAGELTTGQLLAFTTIAASALTPVVNLVSSWDVLQEARNAAERLGDVFEAEVERAPQGNFVVLDKLDGALRFEKVSFSYTAGSAPVLDGIELEIPPGQHVAIVGRSGSGKSTLAKLALGLYAPSAGRVSVSGFDLELVDPIRMRRRMGVVPQEAFLFSGSVRDNIAVGDPEVGFAAIVRAARRVGAHEFIRQLDSGYETEVGERGAALSGGQRQRLALARALLHDPDVLILDEATASLDSLAEREILSCLQAATRGRTTLTITHRLATIRDADRILVMENGRIVQDGTHEELRDGPGPYRVLIREQGADHDEAC